EKERDPFGVRKFITPEPVAIKSVERDGWRAAPRPGRAGRIFKPQHRAGKIRRIGKPSRIGTSNQYRYWRKPWKQRPGLAGNRLRKSVLCATTGPEVKAITRRQICRIGIQRNLT